VLTHDKELQTTVTKAPARKGKTGKTIVIFFLGALFGMIVYHAVLRSLPTVRRYLLKEACSTEQSLVQTEQNLLWIWVFLPLVTFVYSALEAVYTLAGFLCPRWLLAKIAFWTSGSFILEKLRQQIVQRAVLKPLQKWALNFLHTYAIRLFLLWKIVLVYFVWSYMSMFQTYIVSYVQG